jgi:hypothetical protein
MASPAVHAAGLLRDVLEETDDTVTLGLALLDDARRARLSRCLEDAKAVRVRHVSSSDTGSSGDGIS